MPDTVCTHLHTKYQKIDLGKNDLKPPASTFMTPTHVTYMVHACSAAVARATAKAARKYAHARAISHSVRENTLARPAVVQPTF